MSFKKNINLHIILISLIFILIASYYAAAFALPDKQEKDFFLKMRNLIEKGDDQFRIAELTDFDWDRVDIIVQIESSYSESSIDDFIKARKYQYKYLDIYYLPRLFRREYETAFIFVKDNKVVKVIRLDKRELNVGDTVYLFNPIVQNSNDRDYWIKTESRKEASQLIKNSLGYRYEENLIFLKPKEN